MSKITRSREVRMMEEKTFSVGKGKKPVTVMGKRAVMLPPKQLFTQGCAVCHQPMEVAVGQVARYHRACRAFRKEVRSIIRR